MAELHAWRRPNSQSAKASTLPTPSTTRAPSGAFTSGVSPRRSMENSAIGSVVPAGPETKDAITTSPSDSVKANNQPAIKAGVIKGRVMVLNATKGVAPKSIAASSRLRSASASRACTTTAT